MTKAEERYHEIAASLPDAKEGKMFGALCVKMANGKAALLFKNDTIVFKLTGEQEANALKLAGAQVFDPRGGHPMNGWIEVPYKHVKKWPELAQQAAAYVSAIEVKKKKAK